MVDAQIVHACGKKCHKTVSSPAMRKRCMMMAELADIEELEDRKNKHSIRF